MLARLNAGSAFGSRFKEGCGCSELTPEASASDPQDHWLASKSTFIHSVSHGFCVATTGKVLHQG